MEKENFKSEKERQNYYRKLHFRNNDIAQKNEDRIVEAYHEIEFGVVPEIADNRSLAEKLADSRKTQDQAEKNALTLMSNDGTESIKLINLIGTARYDVFNKHFLDIYNSLKGQVGKIKAQEAYDFINKYIEKYERIGGVDIPNTQMLDKIIEGMKEMGYTNETTKNAVEDVVLRIQALESVLNNGINEISYSSSNLPSKSDIEKIIPLRI